MKLSSLSVSDKFVLFESVEEISEGKISPLIAWKKIKSKTKKGSKDNALALSLGESCFIPEDTKIIILL